MPTEPVTRHRCVVLIVDDDAELREVLRAWLSSDGYEVRTAPDGRAALRVLRSTPETCIILLDSMMPIMDAAAFRAAQCRDRALAWIPVVLMSGGLDTARTARELGARSFVQKPFDPERVRDAVRQIGCASRPRHP